MSGTYAARRKAAAQAAAPCRIPCMRCIHHLATGGVRKHCGFAKEYMLIRDFNVNGEQANRCAYCLERGEDCMKPPTKLRQDVTKLITALDDLDRATTEQQKTLQRARVQDIAREIKEAVVKLCSRHSQVLRCHDGKDEWTQIGLTVEGRSRSNSAANDRRKAYEADLALSVRFASPIRSPRRPKYGIVPVEQTPSREESRVERGLTADWLTIRRPAAFLETVSSGLALPDDSTTVTPSGIPRQIMPGSYGDLSDISRNLCGGDGNGRHGGGQGTNGDDDDDE